MIDYSPAMVNASLPYRYAAPESGFGALTKYPLVQQEFHPHDASVESIQDFNTGWGSIFESGAGFYAIGTGRTVRERREVRDVSTAPFGARVVESGFQWPWEDDVVETQYSDTPQAQLDEWDEAHPEEQYTPLDELDQTTQPEDDPAYIPKKKKKKKTTAPLIDPDPAEWKAPSATDAPTDDHPPGNTINDAGAAGLPWWVVAGLVAAGGYTLYKVMK